MPKSMKKLSIDKEFKSLIRPLTEDEFRILEESIRNEGCRDPIVIWNGTILDGHNRYAICKNWKIPFETEEMHFSNREMAIAWICMTQLGRRNISDEMRRYLIGKRYNAEKAATRLILETSRGVITRRIPPNVSQSPSAERYQLYGTGEDAQKRYLEKNRTSERIAKEYHICHGTVEKYARYSRAIDRISSVVPNLAPRILAGECKITYNNVIDLARKNKPEMRKYASNLALEQSETGLRYCDTRERLQDIASPTPRLSIQPGIKNMPAPNPDAVITSLTLTVPTWISSIQRSLSQSDIIQVSFEARKKLEGSLNELKKAIDIMLEAIAR